MGQPVKAVVLLSGGLDSATTLAMARNNGRECHALSILYGQRHVVELQAAERIAKEAESHKVIEIPLNAWGGSALTADLEVPKNALDETAIPITYVPARNTIFLALALGYAEVLGAEEIWCGVNALDYSGYPDCRPEFIHAFQELARVGTKQGVEGDPIKIKAPLIHMTKVEVIQTGLQLGVDYGQTHSCYDPAPDGRPCTECDSCLIRQAAFDQIGIPDPARS